MYALTLVLGALPLSQALSAGFMRGIILGRDTTTTCADITLDVPASLNAQLGTTLPDDGSTTELCLCVSDIPAYVANDPTAQEAVSQTGSTQDVIDAYTNIITGAASATSCTFPDNSESTCDAGNVCAFECTNGFEQEGGDCVCNQVVCNGQCQATCPTGGARRREYQSSYQVMAGGGLCPLNTELCGGWKGPNSFECVNTRTDLESCGGCVNPYRNQPATGQDCSAIPGVESVSCQKGSCVVDSCEPGWKLKHDRSGCKKLTSGLNATKTKRAQH